ncbi:MAG: SgcJ/EcaC family oxidoreductase [Thermoguttaceae bacterium]
MPRRTILTALLAAFSAVAAVRAADPPNEPPQAVEVRKAISDLEKKFNDADARSLAACWAPQGEFIGPDSQRIEGRDNIEKAFNDFFATTRKAKLKMLVTTLRMLGDEAAILDVIALRTPAPTGFQGEPLTTLVLARHEGQWLVESAHETLVTTVAHCSHLKDLEGLVGDWAAKSAIAPGVSWKSTCDWTANRSFLIRKFIVDGKAGPIHSGTEVIGWDPRGQRIFSWVFESDGGFGQSVWIRDGERLIVKYAGVAPDGADLSVTQVLTRVDVDTASLRFIDREIEGVKQPDTVEVQIKRTVPHQPVKLTASASAMPPRRILP